MPDINKTDLVARLRDSGTANAPKTGNGVYMSICDEAADAIEALTLERVDKAEAWDAIAAKNAIIASQAAEISRLRDALKPFAEMIPTIFGPEYLDRSRVSIEGKHGYASVQTALHVGDFRRARTALEANHG